MNKKELRALITIAGKVDPSLQVAMLKASGESMKTSGKIGKMWGSLGTKLKSGAVGLLKGLGTTILAVALPQP